jgi:2-isopropylmalate synthase
MADVIEIYDTTLRDGTQGQGFTLTSEDKVAIALRLDVFGVDFIEGGWPGSNPKDVMFFEAMKDVVLERSRLTAFGSTCRKGTLPEDDTNIQALVEAGTPVVTIFGKSWTLHVTDVLGATHDQNLEMIRQSIAFMTGQGREVIFDAEHYFDGWKADAEYAEETLSVAVEAGATRLVLCDTNGGSLPGFVKSRVRSVVDRFQVPVGIHAHNDSELAVANSLFAVEAGASHVQGTMNGYGERCGNTNLISVLGNLVLKFGIAQPQNLETLRDLSRYIDERANLQPTTRSPYVGDAAFAHKGGVHVSAINKRPETYEHVNPSLVGNKRRILVSDLSGRANVMAKASEVGERPLEDLEAAQVVQRMKELENRGYAFEGAEASYHLMVRKVRGDYQPFFVLHGYTVFIDKRDIDLEPRCEASIRVEVGGELEHTAAEGDGPVNALAKALEKVLIPFFPCLSEVELVDYKVRVLAGAETGTASVVRVLVEMSDGRTRWSTVGASTNIIDSSYEALIDAIEYKLMNEGVEPPGKESPEA